LSKYNAEGIKCSGKVYNQEWNGMEPEIIFPIMKHRLEVSIAKKFCIGRELETVLSSPLHI